MSGAEVGHRLAEQGRRSLSRFERRDWQALVPVDAPLPTLPGLVDGLCRLAPSAALRAIWREVAERAATGRWLLLGQEWPGVRGPRQWSLDPVTGGSWPADRYCFAIDHRHSALRGDVKYVWELNRLQYLQPIAALAHAEGDAQLAAFCRDEIESWIDHNPPFFGVSWKSGIELGLRIASLLVVISLLGDAGFTAAQRHKIWGTLAAHSTWLARFPSRFS